MCFLCLPVHINFVALWFDDPAIIQSSAFRSLKLRLEIMVAHLNLASTLTQSTCTHYHQLHSYVAKWMSGHSQILHAIVLQLATAGITLLSFLAWTHAFTTCFAFCNIYIPNSSYPGTLCTGWPQRVHALFMGYVLLAWWRTELHATSFFPFSYDSDMADQPKKNCLHRPPLMHGVQHWVTVYDFSCCWSPQNHRKRTKTRQSCSPNSAEMKWHAPQCASYLHTDCVTTQDCQDGHALRVVCFTSSQHATSTMLTKTSKRASEPFLVDVTGSYRHNPDNLATFKTKW